MLLEPFRRALKNAPVSSASLTLKARQFRVSGVVASCTRLASHERLGILTVVWRIVFSEKRCPKPWVGTGGVVARSPNPDLVSRSLSTAYSFRSHNNQNQSRLKVLVAA